MIEVINMTKRDDGDVTRPHPGCLARIANGVWCQLADGHAGEHASDAAPLYGPIEARPAGWRVHPGQSVVCGKEVGGWWCGYQEGHSGPCGR